MPLIYPPCPDRPTAPPAFTAPRGLAALSLLAAAALHLDAAHAACNFYTNDSIQSHTLVLPSSLNFARDAPPGTVLHRAEEAAVPGNEPKPNNDPWAFALCSSPGRHTRQATAPFGTTSGGSAATLARTNLAGIGLRFYFRNNSGRDYRWQIGGSGSSFAWSFIGPWGWYWNGPSYWGVELVRTDAPFAPGSLDASGIAAQLRLDNLLVTTLNIAGTTTIQAQSCSAQAAPVHFGRQVVPNPGAVGSTTGLREATIHLRNCPPGLTAIRYQLKAVHGELHAGQAVAALAPAADAATGYGIQITDGNGSPVPFGTSHPVPGYVAGRAGDFSIPLRAAYYRMASHITHGSAHSAIEFTMNYD